MSSPIDGYNEGKKSIIIGNKPPAPLHPTPPSTKPSKDDVARAFHESCVKLRLAKQESVASKLVVAYNALVADLARVTRQRDELVDALEKWTSLNTRDLGDYCSCSSCEHYDFSIALLARIKVTDETTAPLRRADIENEVLGLLLKFKNHRITFDDAVQQLTDRIHKSDNA